MISYFFMSPLWPQRTVKCCKSQEFDFLTWVLIIQSLVATTIQSVSYMLVLYDLMITAQCEYDVFLGLDQIN